MIGLRPLLAACGLALAGLSAPALAQGGGGAIELELNTATDVGAGCRLTYVATNATATTIQKTSYEVAVYDLDGIVKQLLVLDFGWLPSGKTRVVQFDLPDNGCSTISRISVNGPVECTSATGEVPICRDNNILSSRVRTIQFN